MSLSIVEKLDGLLRFFVDRYGSGVFGVLVVRSDGLPVHVYWRGGVDVRLVCGSLALLATSLKKAYSMLKEGDRINTIIVEGNDTRLLVKSITIDKREVYVCTMVDNNVNLGLVLLDLERLCDKVKEALQRCEIPIRR